MGSIHTYLLKGEWSGGRNSVGHIESSGITSKLSAPANLDGPGVGTNPEELLLSSAAGCYMITLASLLTNRSIPYIRIELESEAFVENDKGLRFDRIEHRPTVVVEGQVDVEKVKSLTLHAEHACMVSSALRGNVEVTVKPTVLVQETSK